MILPPKSQISHHHKVTNITMSLTSLSPLPTHQTKQQKYNQGVAFRFFIVNKIKNNIEHKVALIAIADCKLIANGMFSDS